MTCKNNNIKLLLPAYHERSVDQPALPAIEKHLETCGDCKTELAFISIMAGEAVPEPAEAFWKTMPDRIYQAVQQQNATKKRFTLSWFATWPPLPRWTMAASVVGVALLISWFTVRPFLRDTSAPFSQNYESISETGAVDSLNVTEFSQNEMDAVEAWTGNELALIAQEAAPALVTVRSADLYEELADLNTQEIERFSNMMEQLDQEG
jgi:hypothetical protein